VDTRTAKCAALHRINGIAFTLLRASHSSLITYRKEEKYRAWRIIGTETSQIND